MVPNGWKLVEAKDVCESISVGVVIKPTQYYVDENEGVKAFRSANVREGFINDTDWVYFSYEGHAENKKSQLKAGDILIVRTGYPGTACVVTPEFEGSNAIDIVIARPDMKQIISEYLCAYTNSHMGKSQVLDLQGGMAQKHLNVGAYQVLKIKLPPLPEQKKIAQILSTWDKAITTTEQLLANSQQQKKALMQQLLTGKKRLLDKNGERFGGEWEKVKYADVVVQKSGNAKLIKGSLSGMPFENGYPGYSASGQDVWLDYYEYDCNAIIVSAVGSRCGKCFLASGKWSAIANTHVILPDERRIDVYFLSCHINDEEFWIRGGSGQPFVKIKDTLKKVIFLPNLKEQQKIAEVLSTADQEVTALQQNLDALKQEKKALMQQLLTGKRRVKIDHKEVDNGKR